MYLSKTGWYRGQSHDTLHTAPKHVRLLKSTICLVCSQHTICALAQLEDVGSCTVRSLLHESGCATGTWRIIDMNLSLDNHIATLGKRFKLAWSRRVFNFSQCKYTVSNPLTRIQRYVLSVFVSIHFSQCAQWRKAICALYYVMGNIQEVTNFKPGSAWSNINADQQGDKGGGTITVWHVLNNWAQRECTLKVRTEHRRVTCTTLFIFLFNVFHRFIKFCLRTFLLFQ